MKLNNRKLLLIVLFAVFLFLRLFADLPAVLLASDSLKFLNLAKHFPYHTLGNNQLYLLHAPFYPYLIHFVSLLVREDYLAAIAINFVSACITFFVIYRLFMMLTNDFSKTFISLLFFTLSVDLIIASRKVTRESFVMMLLISAIYLYVKWAKHGDKKSILGASIISGILGITTDHVVFLLPSFALSYLLLNRKRIILRKLNFPNLKYAILPVVFILVFYGFWLGVRTYHYSSSDYYPAGLEGAPIKTKNFGLTALMNPKYFEGFDLKNAQPGIIPRLKNVAYIFGYMFNTEPLSIARGLNLATMKFLLSPWHVAYAVFIYLPLVLATIYGFFLIIRDFFRTRKIYNNVDLYILLLFLIFLFPITQRAASPRFVYPAYIFLFYVMAHSMIALSGKIGISGKNAKTLFVVIVVLLLLLVPVWHYRNNHFVFSAEKYVFSEKTGEFINKNIGKADAIMTQPGYTYKLIYLTGNRVISLPENSKDLSFFLKYYNISYVLFGRFYTFDKYYYSDDSAQLIKNSPDKFKLIATVKEDYTKFLNPEDPASTDEVYIYKVLN